MQHMLQFIDQRFLTGLLIAAACWGATFPIQPADAITITMEYTDEGDPPPHDENPTWDPSGVILKAHFQAAKAIWEALLPGEGTYSFDFHWDDDIAGLGLHTSGIDEFIEINPIANWYADPFPNDNTEFSAGTSQTLFSGLSAADQTTYFPGTAPPGALETRFNISGSIGSPGAGGFDAANGIDLLTVVLHEVGHALGISGTEPGEYNIYPQHVGGLSNVLVLEDNDSGHLAGNRTVPGFLMCDACETTGVRRLPTATDVLVIAEDQGITIVQLARVGRISSGLWNEANAWIGGVVPAAPQDVYITHGGTVTLSADASAKNLLVTAGSSLLVQDRILSSTGTLNFAGATAVSVDAGGIIYANNVIRGATDLATTALSQVLFNSYAGGSSNSASFNGTVGIGTGSSTDGEITFDPSTITTWTIAAQLSIGDLSRPAHFVIDNGMDVTSSSGRIGNGTLAGPTGRVTISGAGSSWTIAGWLDVRSGNLSLANDGRLDSASGGVGSESGLANVNINDGTWIVTNDLTIGPASTVGEAQGVVTIQNSGDLNVDGNVTVRGTTTRSSEVVVASQGLFRVDGNVLVGPFGIVTYRDQTYAHSGVLGAETLENLGGTSDSGAGGLTRFMDTATAGNARLTNRPGATAFAGGGQTQFRNLATAGNARVDNMPGVVSYNSGAVRFYDFATAGEGEFYNHPGFPNIYATVEFNGDSTGGDGTFTNLPGVLGQSVGGAIIFKDRSQAGFGTYTSQGEGGIVEFNDFSSADHGTFSTADNVGGNSYIRFNENSTADAATFTIRTNTSLLFYNNSTAADAQITARGGNVSFSGDVSPTNVPSSTAGNAQIVAEGGAAFGAPGSNVVFSTWSTAGNATITAQGGTASGAYGGSIQFDYSGQAGNATLIANGGTTGGAGGVIYFRRAATGDNSRIIVNSGGVADFGGNIYYGGTSVGSIEGAGTFGLNGSELRTGSLNTSTIVSGSLVDTYNTNGQLTKVGAGTLTLAGNNTYTGLTKVKAGTLAVNGSILGDALVESGATLGGTGTIGGEVEVAPGGTLAPGLSPGTLTVGSLTLNAASILNFEFGVVSDLVIVTGDLVLDGVVNIGPGLAVDDFGREIFTYGGTLINNGLTIGSVPPGFSPEDFTFDYNIAGQIRILADVPELPGDYNENGTVDAADYVVWRENLGSGTALPNDDTPGVGPDDYDRWVLHFGQPTGSGSGATIGAPDAAVPEPACIIVLITAALLGLPIRRPLRE